MNFSVSLSISNRVLKPNEIAIISNYGVSLSISNRVLKRLTISVDGSEV